MSKEALIYYTIIIGVPLLAFVSIILFSKGEEKSKASGN